MTSPKVHITRNGANDFLRLLRRITTLSAWVVSSPAADIQESAMGVPSEWVHPDLINSKQQLDFVKAKVVAHRLGVEGAGLAANA